MSFSEELAQVLPEDLPNRAELVAMTGQHLDLIAESNRSFNLTRVTDPHEAAIKHVLDSVLPWRCFAQARHILDAGTGAGFPGIPLALVLPKVHFTLAESIGKKARFVEAAVAALMLKNVRVVNRRAEEALQDARADIVTARAVAPINRAAELFGPAVKHGATCLLYKGPDVELEIAEAEAALRKQRLRAAIVQRYELPEGLGVRTIVEMRRFDSRR